MILGQLRERWQQVLEKITPHQISSLSSYNFILEALFYAASYEIGIKGLLFTVQKALPLLPEGASIILNPSTSSCIGTPAFSFYSATKAAVRSFAHNWILDLKERKIRVNAISSGVVPTPGYTLLGLSKEQAQEFVDSQAVTIQLG